MKYAVVCFGILIAITACTKTSEEKLLLEAELGRLCEADSIKFTTDVVPIINSNCMPCHNNEQQKGGITLVTYDDISAMADNGSLMGTIRHESGYVAMPENAAKINDCYIHALETWISNGKPNN